MVNVLYDMTNVLHDYTGVTVPYFAPYVGVGVGYQWSHLSGFTASAASGFPSIASDDTYGAIAYQFILGGAVPIPSVRGLAMTADYRFLGVGSRKYNVTAQATATSPATFGTAKLGNDFNHAVVIGLRYNFGQPPPPPRRPALQRFRLLPRRVPTWYSLIGTRQPCPIAHAKLSRTRRTTRPRCSTPGSR
jgi:OOP family OmpA-OmpF porin